MVAALACFVTLLAAGCVETREWQVEPSPWEEERVASAERVRVLRTDGREVELVEAELTEGESGVLRGKASSLDSATIEIPIADIRRLEITSTKPLTRLFRGISGTALLLVAVGVFGLLLLADGTFEFR